MVFSSTIFLFAFLPITLLGYYLIRKDLRNVFLLIMSIIFYAVGEPNFVIIMVCSIAANYLFALLIAKTMTAKKALRRFILIVSVLVDLGLLFYYKYFDFFIKNINGIFGTNFALQNIVLPIGISFFTFQGMSYMLDVYMGKTEVQKNPLNVALYVALFPQLVAGPIVRYTDINEQIILRKETVDGFASGIQRFSFGLAKKVILSNNFALLADTAFNMSPENLGAGLAWLGALAYTMQIYFDFSGYSDMAIGLGHMFGFTFPENFNYPYISTSISDFWRRWHISLSSWFRDYIYIPLGGNRRGNVYIHLSIVFLLTGIWHGASWNFVLWGIWHGIFIVAERVARNHNKIPKLPKVFKWLYTMLAVIIGWVLFRAADLSSAVEYIKCMFGAGTGFKKSALYALQDYGIVFVIGIICMLPVVKKYKKLCEKKASWNKASTVLDPLVCVVLLVFGISFTVASTYNPFIYFNF